MKIGIVGLPNVGKSTLFKALTKKQVIIENYPFATIEPNVGVVAVPDERLDKLAAVSKSEKIIPATIEFLDIAGLVKNAHQGEGLGNQFLSHIREVDAIVEVVRDFIDENVIHVEGAPDPKRDRDIIHLELAMADLETITRRLERASGKVKSGDKTAAAETALLEKIKNAIDEGRAVRDLELSPEEKKELKSLSLLTAKPVLVVRNIAENQIKSTADGELTISAKIEAELADLEPTEAASYLQELGLQSSGLDRLIKKSYELLNLITFFTSGPKETRAWTIRRGTRAPEAAGVIHTDFEKGFIRAEIIPWKKLVEAGGEIPSKEKGWLRLEGKEYIMQDGDVAHFRFAPT
ncbi:redox-regulated ATPase YchF [Candidatus Uhrbacteria bacterium RIFCSPHIGHO2_12_FULL_46_13]|uniref:Ribosome-binding ATPase YchF n=1 Tax=Candidatus Uhrbacteria bacterium RIFCSPLOWO2_01_FULL_47_25 TaxID=1802402 RepID=A0A1F7UZA8_9BACT|nr:MAG: redox-regulated ATPase YchF [Candidatus Uhrbacteria bacterium RIFCSPHIGHO2_01_FULL_46_23]OGL70581.1 MAG: redox-regulated ATPase YchF [Candidatus Uhrbacteria bacterium RIFCSPHIGHO2_02_FULL_47_29]OGL74884.1 MAG: redox-regulated ATPase YchF [Candidatus Uhrbacteria bacterium RIFCSPHIGHO2_12_FULL_46_13]OGL83114.1 MAG: redox-regulated ATPase YchF [Candidatus Uhrbacteria bacterium RIFCSPLOWO2_01_FULL_47_25]OGL84482.1 MAG: redox-regulated ATPase YchF [Candidatus Uhrbacteria bacterium RIFCSPLOWO